MSLVALCSAKGSPGVTTASLALASADAFRDTALLVEVDPSGGDIASRLGFPAEPGLASLAAAGRREFSAELIEGHSQRVAGIDVVAAPAGASSARSALHVLAPALALALRTLAGRVVICDLGRLDAESASIDVAKAADLVLVVTRPVLADLAHVAEEGSWWARLGPPVALVLSGEPGAVRRERYPAGEVSSALGLEVAGTLAWDPKGVAALARQGRDGRRSALVQTARSLSAALVQRLPRTVPEAVQAVRARSLTGPAPAGAEV
jgi:hypothetical protein